METTGLNPERDRIVQLSITMFYPEPGREPIEWSSLINPECDIPPGINHGITDEMVDDQPTFRMLADDLHRMAFHDGVDLCGYNVEFDKGFLKAEFGRAGIDWLWNNHTIDPFLLFKKLCGHKLQDAYRRFVDKKGFEGAHDASNDTRATWQVLVGQLLEYEQLPRHVAKLSEFCYAKPDKQADWFDTDGKFVWRDGEVTFNFGKWRNVHLKKVQRGYLMWLSNTDQSIEVKQLILEALEGRYPTR